jgi:hypothetical protein
MEEEAITLLLLLKNRNSSASSPAGISKDIEAGVAFLRSQEEETYKLMIGPVIAYFITQLSLHNDKVTLVG